MVVVPLSDAELDVNIGRAYRAYLLAEKAQGFIALDTFAEWFRETYGFKIVGQQDEYERISTWLVHFPSEADMVTFKLTHL